MAEHRFDGRVAVVTGAGRGIGRAYARLLADRGASVVVNDLGGGVDGSGADDEPAATVAEEIRAAGGVALADTNDVAVESGAAALVAAAVDRFGPVDVLINNAGIMGWAGMPAVTLDDLRRHLAVHVTASLATARAAWPQFVARGYGRIVMTTSTGMLGRPDNIAYATAKGGVLGLTKSLATAGAEHGIKVNAIAPAAMTRMAGAGEAPPTMAPELVAPMAAFLAHEDCPVTGETFVAGFGRFARLVLGCTDGYVHPEPAPTIEDVADHWATIVDETGATVHPDLASWSAAFLSHLQS